MDTIIRLENFDRDRDFDLYVAGYLEALRDSYQGLEPSIDAVDSIRSSVGSIEPNSHSIALTALQIEVPVGFAIASIDYLFELPIGYVECIYVEPTHRGTGIGKSLLDKLSEWCGSKQIEFIRLDVSAGNRSAVDLYEAQGFAIARYQMVRKI